MLLWHIDLIKSDQKTKTGKEGLAIRFNRRYPRKSIEIK